MKLIRHLAIIGSLLIAFFLLGHWIPRLLHSDPRDWQWIAADPSPTLQDSATVLSLHDDLQREMSVLKTSKKRGSKPEIWTVGKGVAIPVYLLRAQRQIRRRSGSVLRMEELNGKQQSARLMWRDSLGDSCTVEIRIGDTFLDNSSRLAIGFVLIQPPTAAELHSLSTLSAPYSILVQPFDTNKTLLYDLDQLPNKEIVAWLGMEPHRYPWISPGPKSILIHHSEREISDLIDEVVHRIPSVSGITTRMGERAVEHKPLMQALLRALGKRKLWFLDLTQNRFSRSSEVCSELGIPCRKSRIKPSEIKAEEYLRSALNTAVKSGENIVILPLSEENVNAVRASIPQADSLGTQIVKLSALMVQSE